MSPFQGQLRRNRHAIWLKTAQRFFWILNILPVRAKVKANRSPILLPLQGVGVYTLIPRALPWAVNWLPFQGAPFRALFVYHVRHRRKRPRADIQRRFEAKHCSSLCSQSEGGEYYDGQARTENPTRTYPIMLAVFATCSWSSLCEQSELQCFASETPPIKQKRQANSKHELTCRFLCFKTEVGFISLPRWLIPASRAPSRLSRWPRSVLVRCRAL